nr:MAG TPA: hypothetical protein [Crassvirales sp.]
MKSPSTINKTDEESAETLLKRYYLTAEDLTIIIPGLKVEKARKYISEIQEEMKKNGYFIPESRPKLALTKLIKKKFGL